MNVPNECLHPFPGYRMDDMIVQVVQVGNGSSGDFTTAADDFSRLFIFHELTDPLQFRGRGDGLIGLPGQIARYMLQTVVHATQKNIAVGQKNPSSESG